MGRQVAVRKKVHDLLREGRSPAEVAAALGLALSVVFTHCDALVVVGAIRRSDILLSIPKERRKVTANLKTIIRYGLNDPLLGDLYEDLRTIEASLHERVVAALVKVYKSAWWTSAVPERARNVAERRRENDRQPSPRLEQYLSMSDVAGLVENHWSIVQGVFPPGCTKTRVDAYLARLVSIRNWIMHPARGIAPKHGDLTLTREAGIYLGLLDAV